MTFIKTNSYSSFIISYSYNKNVLIIKKRNKKHNLSKFNDFIHSANIKNVNFDRYIDFYINNDTFIANDNIFLNSKKIK